MTPDKWCYRCKKWLDESLFGRNRAKKDGLSTECRYCKKISDAESHRRNRKKRLANMAEYRQEHLGELNKKAREYARSERGRENNNRATRAYYQRNRGKCLTKCKNRNITNPEKYKAEYQVGNAIKLGKLTRPELCQGCKNTGRVEAHHRDYTKPFEVVWLCKKCHGKEHRKVV